MCYPFWGITIMTLLTHYSKYGSTLLGRLSYNCGSGVVNKSSNLKSLKPVITIYSKPTLPTAVTQANSTKEFIPEGLTRSLPYSTTN